MKEQRKTLRFKIFHLKTLRLETLRLKILRVRARRILPAKQHFSTFLKKTVLEKLKRWFPRVSLYVLLFFGALELLQILIYKYVPVPFTNTMVLSCLGGKDCKIYYRWVPYEQISDYAKLAVIGMEDGGLAYHSGVDWEATSRALKEERGGSTITQQVAKNVLLWQGRGWSRYLRKSMEIPLSYVLELFWSKRRILEVYLNIAELGPGTFGVEMASQRYFGHAAQELSLWEAALLAAALPNPNYYLVAKPNGRMRWRQSLAVQRILKLKRQGYLGRISRD